MTRKLFISALLLPFVAVGCFSIKYASTTTHKNAPKPSNCQYDFLTTRPNRGFVQLGVIDVDYHSADSCSSAARMTRLFRPYVCRAGGDAAIVSIDKFGCYSKAAVVKYVP